MDLKLPITISNNWYLHIREESLFFTDPIYNLLLKTPNSSLVKQPLFVTYGSFKEILKASQRGVLTLEENLIIIRTKVAKREYQQLSSKEIRDIQATLEIIPKAPQLFLNFKEDPSFSEARAEFKELKSKTVPQILITISDNEVSFKDLKSLSGGFEVIVTVAPTVNYRGSFSCDGHILKILEKADRLYDIVKTEYTSWLLVEFNGSLLYYKVVDSTKDNKFFKDFDPLSFL